MGVAVSTLYDWKKKHQEISEALKKGKEIADIEVENALFKKALGYNVSVKKTFKIREVLYKDGKRVSEKEHLETAYDEVHIPADTTAQIYWLKNRMSDKWRDKPVKDEEKETVENDGFLSALDEKAGGLDW